MSIPVVLFQKMTWDRSKIRFLLIGPCRPKSISNLLWVGWGKVWFLHLPDESYARSLQALGTCALWFFNRIKIFKHCSISFLKRVICLNSKPVWFLSFVGYIRKIKRYIITECAKNILLYYYTPIANCLLWCHLFISNRLNQRTSTPMRIYCHPLESSVWP